MNIANKYKLEMCLSVLNIIMILLNLLWQNTQLLGIYMMVMIFIVYFLIIKKKILLLTYGLLSVGSLIVFLIFLYCFTKELHMYAINIYIQHFFFLISSVYIRKKLSF